MSGEVVQITLGQGIDEGSDPKQLPPGKLLVGQNIVIDKLGRLAKRNGTKGFAKSVIGVGNLSAGERLVTRGFGDIEVVDSTNVNSWVAASNAWQPIDRAPNLYVTQRPLIDSERSAGYADIAVYSSGSTNLLVTVFQCGSNATTSPIYIQVEDLTTHAKVMPATAVATAGGRTPRVLLRGANAVVIWTTSGGAIEVQEYSLTTFAAGAGGAIATGLKASSMFDACFIGNTLYVAYELSSGTNRFQVQSFNGASSYASVNTSAAVGGNGALCIAVHAVTADSCWLAWSQSSDHKTYGAVFTLALGTTTGATQVYASGSNSVFIYSLGSGTAIYGYSGTPNGAGVSLVTFATGTSMVANANTTRQTWGLAIWSKPWAIANRYYAACIVWVYPDAYESSNNFSLPMASPSAVVVEIKTTGYSAAVATHIHTATLVNQTSWLPTGLTQPAIDGSGNVWVTAPITDRNPYGFNTVPMGFYAFKMTANGGDQSGPNLVGPNAFLTGGAPAYFDGTTSMPAGFIHSPIISSVSIGAGASGSMAAGNYYYSAVYEWRDANGILHRSIPAPPVQAASVNANGSVTLGIRYASICGKQTETTGYGSGSASPVMIAVYRTTVGGTGPLYRLTYEPVANVITNDPTSEAASFLDKNADSDISGTLGYGIALNAQAQLYTNSEVEDVPPPAFITARVICGRTVGIAPDARTMWLSKNITEDPLVAPGFNEELTLTFDVDKNALAPLDNNIVAFGTGSIHVVYGDGPDSDGNQNTWQIQRIHTDVGCSAPRSVICTPDGILFQSTRGVELVNRKLVVEWVGRPAMATLATYPVITSAVLVPEQHHVRFTCNNTAGSLGIILVYDYLYKEWFTWQLTDTSDTGASSMPFADALYINGVYTLVTANGQVYQEDTTTNLDGGSTWVIRDVQLAWVSPGGKVTWQRCKAWQVEGTVIGNHQLELSVGHDYSGSWDTVTTFADGTEGTAIGGLQRVKKECKFQKVQATRVRLRDLAPGSTAVGIGAGPIWEGLGLLIQPKAGLPKTAAVEQG